MPVIWHRRHAVLGVFALAALLRLPALERCPPPIQQDEASRAYDAWCLLETGEDRHGASWPLFLESFGPGDFTAALSTYISIPFVALFGPGALSVRLPDALFGVLTVILLHGWLKRQYDERFALAAALFLALDPWHVSICRTGHESGYAPFFLVAALSAAYRAGLLPGGTGDAARGSSTHSSSGFGILAGLAAGFLAWLYPATRLLTPLLFLAWLMTCAPRRAGVSTAKRSSIIAAVIGVVVGAAPLWITALAHPERLAARAGVTIFATSDQPLSARVSAVFKNYAANLSPQYQFQSFDDISGSYYDGVGLHLLVFAPFVVAGLIRTIIQARQAAWSRFLLAWFVLYLLPAAICLDWNPHSFRTVGGIPLFAVLAGTGWRWAGDSLIRWRPAALAPARNVMLVLIGANGIYFAHQYFRVLPGKLELGYQTALVRAMEFAGPKSAEADFVLVTQRTIQPYIYALLYAPIPPTTLEKMPAIRGGGIQAFDEVVRIGKYFFPPSGSGDPKLTELFVRAWNELPADSEGLVVEEAGRFGAGRVLAVFERESPDRQAPPLEVRWWRKSEDPTPCVIESAPGKP